MVVQGLQGSLQEVANRLYHRGLIGDLLNAPGNLISQVLSPPAATTVETAKAEVTQAPATSEGATAPATTQAVVAVAATTQQPAAAPTSSPKQEQEQPKTTAPAAQAPATTQAPAQQPPKSTAVDAANPPASSSAVPPAADAAPTSVANAAAIPTSNVISASCRQAVSSSPVSASSGIARVSGADATKSGGLTSTTQTPTSPNVESQSSWSNNQTPLVATGVVLGIVVVMGISLLLYWCYRRRRKANMHHHAALPPESPADECDFALRFRDPVNQSAPPKTENRGISGHEQLMIQHPQPEEDVEVQPRLQTLHSFPERSNPYSASPFTYAQAQQYAQSHGFSYSPPPIPEPSPIRIFRWPTRSSRSGSSAPSVFSGWRTSKSTSKGPSRAQSRASRSTVSSILWHGRRDVIARRTMNHTPMSQRNGFLIASDQDSPMHEGLHTPVLDWLHWIRGHQSDNGDPDLNHRKSFASTAESLTSEGSIASSGVFPPTLLSWPPLADGAPPRIDPEALEALRFLPMPLQLKRQSSNGDTIVEPSGSHIHTFQ